MSRAAVQRILITGGAGFIGSALARHLIDATPHEVLVLDSLTYAASPAALASIERAPKYHFAEVDIRDRARLSKIVADFRPTWVSHLAAESHVDRSLDAPDAFVTTNVVGTFELLRSVRAHWETLSRTEAERCRFHHISTDEVFGSLGEQGRFDEESRYDPRSPYAATKAASDHLVATWGHSYGLPVLITNCSNNFGPWQHPEKLIPLVIAAASRGLSIPVYGDGRQVRDWLHVDDHVTALVAVLERGVPGRRYVVGGTGEQRNIDLVRTLCAILDRRAPRADRRAHAEAIQFVADRPGHDYRYAIDSRRLRDELGWRPRYTLDDGLEATVSWYLAHRDWWESRAIGVRQGLPTGSRPDQ